MENIRRICCFCSELGFSYMANVQQNALYLTNIFLSDIFHQVYTNTVFMREFMSYIGVLGGSQEKNYDYKMSFIK